MDKDENFASDSDESDEDFCPEKEAQVADSEADEESQSDGAGDSAEEECSAKNGKSPRKASKKKVKRVKKRKIANADDDEDDEEADEEEVADKDKAAHSSKHNRRSTRQSEGAGLHSHKKASEEKDELEESDEAEKSRTDALWASFLSDVKQPTPAKTTTTASESDAPRPSTSTSTTNGEKLKSVATADVTKSNAKDAASSASTATSVATPEKVTITEVVDFAGEEVIVQKVVSVDSIKENKSKTAATDVRTVRSPLGLGLKRPTSAAFGAAGSSGGRGAGLGSVLNQIGKKQKLSVLEKSKMDWNSFKQNEGIDEQLQTFNKGKDGYLERQDFLQRTDVRQFEIERNLRQSRRNN